jgi:hypothetical protein
MQPVGRCVYCGRDDVSLGREHIIAKSLGGTLMGQDNVLLKASCSECAKATSQLEIHAAHDIFLPLRTILGLHTDKERPNSFSLQGLKKGKSASLAVPPQMYPCHFGLLHYEPPAFLSGQSYKKGINVTGYSVHGPSRTWVVQKLRDLDMDGFTSTVTFKGTYLARLIAKVGYGFGVKSYGAGMIDNSYVRSTILGHTDDVGMWVGCMTDEPPPPASENTHVVRIGEDSKGNVHALVRLFANYRTPEYLVIIGKKPN